MLANDLDVDGDGISITSVGTPASGVAVLAAGGIRYTPNENFNGNDTFTYSLSVSA